MCKLSILETLKISPSPGEVEAQLVVDDAQNERAYLVDLTYDPIDEGFWRLCVRAWWGNDLERQAMAPSDAPVAQEIRRYLECDDDLADALIEAHRDYCEDVRVYMQVAS